MGGEREKQQENKGKVKENVKRERVERITEVYKGLSNRNSSWSLQSCLIKE